MEPTITFLSTLGVTLSAAEQQRLQQFVDVFTAYNAHTNLSAIRKEDAVWQKHIGDSLAVLGFEQLSGKCLDIGTGGGLPGIPLAIMRPEISMTLLDSVGKKITACQSFITALELKNTSAILARAEQLAGEAKHRHAYNVVLSRATAYLPILLAWAENMMSPNGRIILYKTPSDEERRDGAAVARELGLNLVREHSYEFEGQQRFIIVFENSKKKG